MREVHLISDNNIANITSCVDSCNLEGPNEVKIKFHMTVLQLGIPHSANKPEALQ